MEKHGFEHLFDETDDDGKKWPLHERFFEWLRFLPMRVYYRVRPRCLKKHKPYAHLSDEFVDKNAFWLAGLIVSEKLSFARNESFTLANARIITGENGLIKNRTRFLCLQTSSNYQRISRKYP